MIFNLIREIFDLPPNNRIYQNDIKSFREGFNVEDTELIPFTDDETELLSLNEKKVKLKKLKSNGAGVINTIFHEPLVNFIFKKYRRKQDYGLAMMTTSNREIVFVQLPEMAKIYLNDVALGIIDRKANFYASSRKKVSARIDRTNGPYNTILFGETPVGQVLNPSALHSNNPRLIIKLVDLEGIDLDIFLALCFYQWLSKTKNF